MAQGTQENHLLQKDSTHGTSLVVQWLRLHVSNAGDMGSILGQGTRIPHLSWCAKKRRAWGKGQELPSPLQGSHPPQNFTCSPIWKLSEPHLFGFLIATSLLRQSWLNHWPLMIELSLHPLTSLEVGGRAESSNSLIKYLVSLTSRHLNVTFWIVNIFVPSFLFLLLRAANNISVDC